MGKTVDYCVCCDSSKLVSNTAIWMPFISDRAMGLPPLHITQDLGLRTISEGMAYAMCKSLHCQSCGHLFVDYRFDESEMANLYHDYRGDDYVAKRCSYEPDYGQQNAFLISGSSYNMLVEGFLSELISYDNLNILDWGGDTGKNTPFKDKAENVHIYDPSNKSPEVSKAINIYANKNFLGSYNLVVLANVLEHIPFPSQTLNELKKHVNARSILYVEVPYEQIQAEISSPSNSELEMKKIHWHEHINFFTLTSMELLLKINGFDVIKKSTTNINTAQEGVSFSAILQIACKLSV